MTLPSDYVATSSNIVGHYKELFSPVSRQSMIDFANGNSYISPQLFPPWGVFIQNPQVYSGITTSTYTQQLFDLLKSLPEKRTAFFGGPFNSAVFGMDFLNDKLRVTGSSTISFKNSDWSSTSTAGYYYTPWPEQGITAVNKMIQDWFEFAKNSGVTLDYILMDQEGSFFDTRVQDDSALKTALLTDSKFSTEYNGLSSWKDMFEYHGGSLGVNLGLFYPSVGGTVYPNGFAWLETNRTYQSKVNSLLVKPFLDLYPNSIVCDYDAYKSEETPGYTGANSVSEDGRIWPRGLYVGNASSPVLYAYMRQIDPDESQNTCKIYNNNPTKIGPRIDDYSGFAYGSHDKFIKRGPWSAFLLCMAEARDARRTSPNIPIVPWVGSVNMAGEYHYKSLNYVTGSNQSPPEVLSNTWYKNNLQSTTKGFTSHDGSTSAFRILTTGTTGTLCSLEYYYNGITSGVTYIYSYYINLGTGFTGSLARFVHFKQNDYQLPTGITFYQTLPISAGPFYSTGGISFGVGSSGWTKLQWEFSVPSALDINDPVFNTSLSSSVYYGNNSSVSTGGYFCLIADPILKQKGSTTDIQLSSTEINGEYNFLRWQTRAPIGFSNTKAGYNELQGLYLTEMGGNSAYYYELLRHLCLNGSKGFGYFNPSDFINFGITGTFNTVNEFSTKVTVADRAGSTQYLTYFKLYNDCIQDVHDKIGGFTLASATSEPINWTAPYLISGAPGLNGTTWWFRVTVKPGYTMICEGITLSANGTAGTWVGKTGSSLNSIGLTWTAWPLPQEPNIAPTKDFNFLDMKTLSDLTSSGCTFSRGSTATYIGASGYLITVGPNHPRFAYDPDTLLPEGLLIEDQTTNLLNWSESFASTGGSQNDWIDSNLSRTLNQISPDNTANAIKFKATANDATLISTTGMTSSIIRSFSIWIKGITGNENVSYTLNGGTSWVSFGSITNNWKRYELTPSTTTHHVGIKINSVNQEVLLWGAQLESRVLRSGTWNDTMVNSTSYVKTTNSTSSRSTETFFIPTSGLSGWFGLTYGTFIYENKNTGIEQNVLTFFTPNTGGTDCLYLFNTSNEVRLEDRLSGLINLTGSPSRSYVSGFYPKNPINVPIKSAFTYSPNGLKVSLNGKSTNTKTWIGATYMNNIINIQFHLRAGFHTEPVTSFYVRRLRYFDKSLDTKTLNEFTLGDVEQIGIMNPYG